MPSGFFPAFRAGPRPGRCGGPVLAALVVTLSGAGHPSAAQKPAHGGGGSSGLSPCPLVVPRSQAVVQPLRLRPSQVAAKNAQGCLSQFDAIYGANGCPLRLCPRDSGAFQLPDNAASGP